MKEIYLNRGIARLNIKNFSGAASDLSGFLTIRTEHAEGHFNLGLAEKGLGNNEKALSAFNRTIELNPHHEAAFFERGIIKKRLGDDKGFCKDMKLAFYSGFLGAHYYIKKYCKE